MADFLENENVPKEVVTACRGANLDVAWVAQISPSADDRYVLSHALAENRVLLTFDKDFGDLAFHPG